MATRIARALAVIVIAGTASLVPAAASAASALPAVASMRADVDDFSYATWDARFHVGLDENGRARMTVLESVTARFPESDQNRGIVRGLPTTYENAWLEPTVLSVTDETGADVPYETEEEDGLLLILTGEDDFVHGLTTYVIEYEMRDVILAAAPSAASGPQGVDEFYWDLLPLDSTQPIEAFHAEITFDEAMAPSLTGASRCYEGESGSGKECDLAEEGATFRVEAADLAAGEGVTVAIGLEPGTAVQPSARQPNPVTDTVPAIAAVSGTALSIGSWFAVSAFKRSRRVHGGIIVAQYDVPDAMPPLLAAAIIPGAKNTIPAEIVHLAVRGNLRIEEGHEPEQPRLRRLAGGRIPDALDAEALDALFVEADADGVVDLPASSESFAARMTTLARSGEEAAVARSLVTTARSRAAGILQSCAIAVTVLGFGLGLWGVIAGRPSALPAFVAMIVAAFLVLVSTFYAFAKHKVLTAEGARDHEYLMGVKEFIRVAEADRLQMLQSYSGAERRQDGSANVITVYERLLPYAMLFGMEDEWGEVLERAYASEQRGASWIGDPNSPFLHAQLAAFAVSSQASASYASASSSNAGGSYGGGFSGGGGGGGFSGGR